MRWFKNKNVSHKTVSYVRINNFVVCLGITYSADCLAYCSMTHLLWPTRSQQYFLLAHTLDPSDELDEFNEAPHVLHSGYTSLRNSINSGSAQVV